MDDIFKGYGIEITLPSPEHFLKIKETLTRIGISSKKDKTLYQSCHILHKQGRYAIMHFKELFVLDGKNNNFTDEDKARRNTIVNLLAEWNLIDIVNPNQSEDPILPLNKLKILTHNEKSEWMLLTKYQVGKKGSK